MGLDESLGRTAIEKLMSSEPGAEEEGEIIADASTKPPGDCEITLAAAELGPTAADIEIDVSEPGETVAATKADTAGCDAVDSEIPNDTWGPEAAMPAFTVACAAAPTSERPGCMSPTSAEGP
jgi:hypothetical protein